MADREIARLRRDIRRVENTVARKRTEDEYTGQEAGIKGYVQGSVLTGKAAYLPTATYMNEHGVKSALYFATDTFVLYAWTGTAWKSTTLA